MGKKQLVRRRGVVLTDHGQSKLNAARRQVEIQENEGRRFTLEELCDRTQLSIKTITKVLEAKVTVDRHTLEDFFCAFDLTLDREDYAFPDEQTAPLDSSSTVPALPEPVLPNPAPPNPAPLPCISWGEAIDVSYFYGRESELKTLEHWIVRDRCRLIALLGMGGMGKTALSVKLTQNLISHFEFVVWRSLRDAPLLGDILAEVLPILSQQQEVQLPSGSTAQVSRLVQYLRQHRCLLVLDNAETILQGGNVGSHYLPGYEDYGELLQQVGEGMHQSCLILTSREKPGEIAALEGEGLPVRSHALPGLKATASQALFQSKGLSGSESDHQKLTERYRGNPLALKIVATSIRDLFGGSIPEFLQNSTIVFNGIRRLLQQQCDRLCDLEKQILTWLTLHREWVSLAQLQASLSNPVSHRQLLEALESLSHRCLIERGDLGFTLQPVVMEYQVETLLEEVFQDFKTWGQSAEPHSSSFEVNAPHPWFHRYPLIQASAKEYIRQSQVRVILSPLAERLKVEIYPQDRLEAHLQQILARVRSHFSQTPSYSAGNLLHLLHALKFDLTGYDFSHLWIRQAYLVNIPLRDVNFSGAQFEQTLFAEPSTYSRVVAFSPDGTILASADFNHLRLWETATGRLIHSMPHPNWIGRLAFSPDGLLLASGSTDNVIKIWEVASGRCLKILEGETAGGSSIGFSPDGALFVGSYHHQIRIWETATWSHIGTLSDHTQRVGCVAIAPVPDAQGRVILASSSYDQTVRLWDLQRRQCLQILQAHTHLVWHLTFSPDGKQLVTSSLDGTLGLWEVETGTLQTRLTGHTHAVSSATFISEHRLVSSSFDQTLKYWDIQEGTCLHTTVAHRGDVWEVCSTPDGQLLASVGNDKTVKLWDSATKQCIKTIRGSSSQVYGVTCASPTLGVSGGDDELVRLWDLGTGECCQILAGHTSWVWSVAVHPTQPYLATGGGDGTIRLWDLTRGHCWKILPGHQAPIYGLAFSADGQILASCGPDAGAKLWDIASGECLHTFAEGSWVWSCKLAIHAPWLVTANNDETVRLWDIATGECLKTFTGHKERIWAVDLSPDDRLIVSGSEDATAKLWDAVTGECLQTFTGHTHQIKTVAFDPQGQWIATGGQDCTLRLWNLQGECLQTLEGHTSAISSLSFVPRNAVDSSEPSPPLLISGSHDETIRLWDLVDGQCLKVLRSPRLYEGMVLNQVQGLNEPTLSALQELGAIASF